MLLLSYYWTHATHLVWCIDDRPLADNGPGNTCRYLGGHEFYEANALMASSLRSKIFINGSLTIDTPRWEYASAYVPLCDVRSACRECYTIFSYSFLTSICFLWNRVKPLLCPYGKPAYRNMRLPLQLLSLVVLYSSMPSRVDKRTSWTISYE